MRAWLAAARLGALHRFTWRLEAAVAVASALAVVVANASLWTAAAADHAIAGLDAPALASYTVVAWLVAAACGGRVEEWVGERFRTGEVAADLLRPLDLLAWALARHLGRAAASLALTAIPTAAVVALWLPVGLPDLAALPAFAVSVVLAAVVGAEIGFLVGVLAARLGRVEGIAHLKAGAVWLLSGALIPVPALPEAAATVAAWLPFQALAHLPAMLYLGLADPLPTLAIQAAWALGLGLAARLAWRGARHRLVVVG